MDIQKAQELVHCTIQTFKDGVCQQEHTSAIQWEQRHINACISLLSNAMGAPQFDRVIVHVGLPVVEV